MESSLTLQGLFSPDESVWSSGHTFPVYVTCVSAFIIVVRALVARLNLEDQREDRDVSHVQAHGGQTLLAAEILRLIGCLELLRVSVSRLPSEGRIWESFGITCIPFVCKYAQWRNGVLIRRLPGLLYSPRAVYCLQAQPQPQFLVPPNHRLD